MFRLLTRENNNTEPLGKMMSKPSSTDLRSSQSTVELSFTSDGSFDDDDDGHRSNSSTCMVLTDYESDSLDSLESSSVTSTNNPPYRRKIGGLRRSCKTHSRSTSSDQATNLRVSFATVTIRTHALCVGDNPAVSLGVPISLDWKILKEETTRLEQYDACCEVHPTGLEEEELAIPANEREAMVRQAGFTTEDIRGAVRQVNTTKMEREKTIDTLKNASQEEFMEKLKKGVWNSITRRGRKNKQKERAMLQRLKERDARRVLVSPAC